MISFYMFILFFLLKLISGNRVIELTDQFSDVLKANTQRDWLVKFYAPWCHHCRQFEAEYMLLAQRAHDEDLPVYIARLDATKYTALAVEYEVKRFPTIMHFSARDGQTKIYSGDRKLDDMLDFVRRLSHSPLVHLYNCDQLQNVKKLHPHFFLQVLPYPNDIFSKAALNHRHLHWFFTLNRPCDETKASNIYVVRRKSTNHSLLLSYDPKIHGNFDQFVIKERFPLVTHVTDANWLGILNMGKKVIMALVRYEQSLDRFLFTNHSQAVEVLRKAADQAPDENVTFGWTTDRETLNRFCIYVLRPLPTFVVLEPQTLLCYFIHVPAHLLHSKNSENMATASLLQQIHELQEDKLSIIGGGNGLLARTQRSFFTLQRSLILLYEGNAILLAVLLTLPTLFGFFILYACCCSELFQEEDDSTNERHTKKD